MNSIQVSSAEVTTCTAKEMESLGAEFLESLPKNKDTQRTYKASLKSFAEYLEERDIHSAEMVTSRDINDYKRVLIERGYSTSTINLRLTVVRALFSWAEDMEHISSNPAARVKGIHLSKEHKKEAFTAEEASAILSGMKRKTLLEKRNYVILLFMFTLGLRTIEICRLDKMDIRRRGERILVYIQGKGSTEKDNFLPLPPSLLEELAIYEEARGEDGEPELFRARSSGRLSPETVSYIVKKEFRRAGYDSPRLTAHSTRHTAITLAAEDGYSLQEVQEYARHSRPETTEIYLHNLKKEESPIPESIASRLITNSWVYQD